MLFLQKSRTSPIRLSNSKNETILTLLARGTWEVREQTKNVSVQGRLKQNI